MSRRTPAVDREIAVAAGFVVGVEVHGPGNGMLVTWRRSLPLVI
jgi:hypothetical protein